MNLWAEYLSHNGRPTQKWKQYLPAYQRHLEKFVDQSILLIEIGVLDGGSLQLWKKFLGPFVRIVGIDINSECAGFVEDQIAVRIGDQKDTAFLQSVIDEFGDPDVVIDDGSHRSEDQISSFRFLYPRLSKNGVYTIEDLHAVYWEKAAENAQPLGNTIDVCKALVDELHGRYAPGRRTQFTDTTRSICSYDSMVVFERGMVQNVYSPMAGSQQTEPGLVIDQRGFRLLDPGEPVPQDT
jgi:hypothetical protein